MSIAAEIGPHLPYLRRFARALSGTQTGGDAHMAALLEALLVDPGLLPRELPSRLGLYRLFAALWLSASPDTNGVATGSPSEADTGFGFAGHGSTSVDRRLEVLTPRTRQAFLLNAVEGFAVNEVALILGVSEAHALDLIEEAAAEIAEQVATTVLIIEDEPVIALDIESMVEDLGHEVIGVARTHREALAQVQRARPGLVLADIQLADGSSGLDAVNAILMQFEVPVIFVTAYPERLLTGNKPEPAFLITKPFRSDMLKATISQALFFDRKAHRKVA